MCIACVHMCRGGGSCVQTICLQTSLQAPREGGVSNGEENITRCVLQALASCCRAQPPVHWHPLRAQASVCCWGLVCAHKVGAHVQAGLRSCSPSFPLNAGEHNPSLRPGGREVQTKLWSTERIAEIGGGGCKDYAGSRKEGAVHVPGGGLGY